MLLSSYTSLIMGVFELNLQNSDAQYVPSFRRWRFEMKLSPFFFFLQNPKPCPHPNIASKLRPHLYTGSTTQKVLLPGISPGQGGSSWHWCAPWWFDSITALNTTTLHVSSLTHHPTHAFFALTSPLILHSAILTIMTTLIRA